MKGKLQVNQLKEVASSLSFARFVLTGTIKDLFMLMESYVAEVKVDSKSFKRCS